MAARNFSGEHQLTRSCRTKASFSRMRRRRSRAVRQVSLQCSGSVAVIRWGRQTWVVVWHLEHHVRNQRSLAFQYSATNPAGPERSLPQAGHHRTSVLPPNLTPMSSRPQTGSTARRPTRSWSPNSASTSCRIGLYRVWPCRRNSRLKASPPPNFSFSCGSVITWLVDSSR